MLLLDLGCGVGNSFWPLVKKVGMPPLRVQCLDFSKRAIALVKEHISYNPKHTDFACCDLVNQEIPFEPLVTKFAQCIFTLSSISPEHYIRVVKKIYDQLAPGAILYFRDYGKYDLGQIRLAKKANAKLKDNFYVCADKTRRYYFRLDEIKTLFCGGGDIGADFECIEHRNLYRVVENR